MTPSKFDDFLGIYWPLPRSRTLPESHFRLSSSHADFFCFVFPFRFVVDCNTFIITSRWNQRRPSKHSLGSCLRWRCDGNRWKPRARRRWNHHRWQAKPLLLKTCRGTHRRRLRNQGRSKQKICQNLVPYIFLSSYSLVVQSYVYSDMICIR